MLKLDANRDSISYLWWGAISFGVALRLSLAVTTVLGTHSDLAVRLVDQASAKLVTPYSWVQQNHAQETYADAH